MGDEVCKRQQKVEAKYREFLGKYEKASVHLQWRLAHGCFHHGMGHFCVKVKQWCGHGANTHPCSVETSMKTPNLQKPKPPPAAAPTKSKAGKAAPAKPKAGKAAPAKPKPAGKAAPPAQPAKAKAPPGTMAFL